MAPVSVHFVLLHRPKDYVRNFLEKHPSDIEQQAVLTSFKNGLVRGLPELATPGAIRKAIDDAKEALRNDRKRVALVLSDSEGGDPRSAKKRKSQRVGHDESDSDSESSDDDDPPAKPSPPVRPKTVRKRSSSGVIIVPLKDKPCKRCGFVVHTGEKNTCRFKNDPFGLDLGKYYATEQPFASKSILRCQANGWPFITDASVVKTKRREKYGRKIQAHKAFEDLSKDERKAFK